jgi:alkylhydroperoxidase family enzyme
MAFFELPPASEISPEARQILDEYKQLTGREEWTPHWQVFARHPEVLGARLSALKSMSLAPGFPSEAKNIAIMLIAHARRCQACFSASRANLERLGFDESTLDGYCANPAVLPLKERDRHFVQYTLKIATGSADLTPKDFRQMEASGLSKHEIQQMIAFAAFWVFNIVFNQSATAGLANE